MSRMLFHVCAIISLSLFEVSVANAAILVPSEGDPVFGWNRGAANSFYYGWDNFTDDDGGTIEFSFDSTPEFVSPTNPGSGVLTANVPGAILSSTNNIYSFGVAQDFTASLSSFNLGAGSTGKVVAQFETIGAELDYANILLNGAAPTSTVVLSRTNLGAGGPGGGGFLVEYLASWNLASPGSLLDLNFEAAGTSLSLSRLHIDGQITAVPEPGTMVVLATAAGAAACRWRRRGSRRKEQLV